MNFARRQNGGWPFRAMLIIAALGVALALWERSGLLSEIDMQQRKVEYLEDTQSRMERRQSATDHASPAARAEGRRLVDELQQPWEAMLDELQKAIRDDLLILRLQPDAATGRLLLSGQADSSEAILEFVERLRRQPAWQAVEPISLEQRSDVASMEGKPLGFQLALQWRRQ